MQLIYLKQNLFAPFRRRHLVCPPATLFCFIEFILNFPCRGLDFAPVDQSTVPNDAPIIIVQHGLTGGKRYPISVAKAALLIFK